MSTRQPGPPAPAHLAPPGPASPAGFEEPVHRSVLRQAATRPDAPAVVGAGTTLTYGQLDGAANHLAAALVARGVAAGDRVVASLPRPVDAAVALLAVARAGATYAAIDPELPDDHVVRLLRDARPAAVLGGDDLDRLARLCAYGIGLDPDEAAARCLAVPASSPVSSLASTQQSTVDEYLRPDQPAYLAWSPDSAGTPTGVLVAHRALASVTAAVAGAIELGPTSRVLLAGPGPSPADVYAALTAGATLILAGAHPDDVASLADRYEPTELIVAAATLAALPAVPTATTTVVAGDPGPAASSAARAHGGRLLRTCTPAVTALPCTVVELGPDTGASVLGRPLTGVRAYVLDDDLAPQPAGAVGQLYLAGAAVPLGYLNRPELAALRFQPDPFAPGLMVRTGVLAYRRPDGLLARLDRAG